MEVNSSVLMQFGYKDIGQAITLNPVREKSPELRIDDRNVVAVYYLLVQRKGDKQVE